MFLILAMCMGLTIPVHATFGSSSSELDYAIGRVERFLGKENYEVVNDLSLSNPIPVYNFDSNNEEIGRLYFAFDGTENIASLLVYSYDDQYCSSFYMSNYKAINQILDSGENIILGCSNDCLLMFTDDDVYILENPNDHTVYINSSNAVPINGMPLSQATELSVAPQGRLRYYNLSVPFVKNDSSPLSGTGLCWAACLASKINYEKGTSLTAIDIWNTCWDRASNEDTVDPEGTDLWVKTAASEYGISIQTQSGQMNTNQITSRLRQKDPAIAVISGKNSSNKEVGHAILLNSFDEDADFYELSFMDPNEAGDRIYIYLSFSHSDLDSGKGFVYRTSWGSTYTSWWKSWY